MFKAEVKYDMPEKFIQNLIDFGYVLLLLSVSQKAVKELFLEQAQALLKSQKKTADKMF